MSGWADSWTDKVGLQIRESGLTKYPKKGV
nr:MAG TPA: hypothetical protein [Caudoviricetes sp.]